MKELSVFVDESGDFGKYDHRAPYYIVSLVLHDQSCDINAECAILEQSLAEMGWAKHCVHAGPVIRYEADYKERTLLDRQKLLKRMVSFVRHLNVRFKSIVIEKRDMGDSIEAAGKLSRQLARFIQSNLEFFCAFDVVKIYYDNGQIELTKILSYVFNAILDNVEFRKVLPADYRLFQVADLICTLKLEELKVEHHTLTKSEQRFFVDERTLKKNYLKPLKNKEMH